MGEKRASTYAAIASMVFALVIAVLAVTDSPALSVVAVVGGILIGIMWVGVGVFGRGSRA